MPTPRNSTDTRQQHERAIDSLASELQAPPAKVRRVYDRELEVIGAGARVTEFLSVIVRRSARECLVCDGRTRKSKCAGRAECTLDLVERDATPGRPR